MADEGATKDPGGQQPDFKKGWDAATHGSEAKLAEQSERATAETAPEPATEAAGQAKAAKILKEAATKDVGSET